MSSEMIARFKIYRIYRRMLNLFEVFLWYRKVLLNLWFTLFFNISSLDFQPPSTMPLYRSLPMIHKDEWLNSSFIITSVIEIIL